jgi:hypothetical protein
VGAGADPRHMCGLMQPQGSAATSTQSLCCFSDFGWKDVALTLRCFTNPGHFACDALGRSLQMLDQITYFAAIGTPALDVLPVLLYTSSQYASSPTLVLHSCQLHGFGYRAANRMDECETDMKHICFRLMDKNAHDGFLASRLESVVIRHDS